MKKAYKYLAWFVAGQAVQIILQLVANGNYMRKPVLFCAAAGFLVAVCVYAGARVMKPEEPMSYLDYAEGKR